MCKLAVEILAKISTASLHIQDPRYPSVLFVPPWRFNIRHLPNTKGAAPFIKYMLSANFDTIMAVGTLTVMGYPLPILPLQILWINIATDALPAQALGQ